MHVKILNDDGLDHILGQSADSPGLFSMLMMVPLAMLMRPMMPVTALMMSMMPLTMWAIAVASVIPAAKLVAC